MIKELSANELQKMVKIPLEYEINTEHHKRAPYASDPDESRGRLTKEENSSTRSQFRRDCDRIIHSAAFRRLEYKTQVFVNHEGDHYRTRLTHSLEVAQIARSISRNLCLNEDLAEAMALAHDLGHTPFGHAGEDALNDAAKDLCGFDHNAQSIKIVTMLEQKYAAFNGLNLSWELLEGLAKHNGPLQGEYRNKSLYDGTLPDIIAEYNKLHDLELDKFPSAEAQIASHADDIAYNNHDIDDGLRANLFSLDDVKKLPMVGNIFRELENEYPKLEPQRLVHEANRRMINRMIVDITRQTYKNIKEADIRTADDVRNLNIPLVTFSHGMSENIKTVKQFLKDNMYQHYKVCRMTSKAKRVITDLFNILYNEPECLPTEWRKKAESSSSTKARAEVVVDFIAGMTDRFAMDEHKKLFDLECKS
jgi:dGTPase